MSLEKQVHALRRSVTLSRMDHVSCLRLSGDDAFDALDRVVPAELYLQDGQILHTLLLGEDAKPLADLYLCRDDEEFILIAEGLTSDALRDHLTGHLPGTLDLEMELLDESHTMLSLNGPYAWELLADLVGPEVVGMPYLSLALLDPITCFRAGKTGEYGYDLLVPSDQAEEIGSRIQELGQRFDLEVATLEALDLCALEGWFFNIRREGRADVTPIELQLQWRVSYRKEYVGSAALADRRSAGPTARLCCLASSHDLTPGDMIRFEERPLGRLVSAGYSFIRQEHLGLALLEPAYAYPAVDRYTVHRDGASAPVRTITPPALNNLSLHVTPQAHSYFTREEFELPPPQPGAPS